MKEKGNGSRRRFLKGCSMLVLAAALSPGMIADTFAHSKSKPTRKEKNLTPANATQPGSEQTDKASNK
jgi:hypothetical protein